MIELNNVSKYYQTSKGRHHVLNDVSLKIEPLEKVGVLGRNGAGKSTLMRLFAGVDIPNRGTITRRGSISWPMGLATGIQVMLTGRENARFACRIQGLSFDKVEQTLDFIKEFSELKKFFDLPVTTYSSGMRARLNFAIAMAFDFDCYIIDELTAVGDQEFRVKSREVFEEKRQKCGFVKVSHNLNELKAECDTALLLADGKLFRFPDIEEGIAAYSELIGQPIRSTPGPKPSAGEGPTQRPHTNTGKKPVLKPTALPSVRKPLPMPDGALATGGRRTHTPAPMMPRGVRR